MTPNAAYARVPKAVILSAIAARKQEITERHKKEIQEMIDLRSEVIARYRKSWFHRKSKTGDQIWDSYLENHRYDAHSFAYLKIKFSEYHRPYLALEALCNATTDDEVLCSPETVTLLKL